MSFVITCTYESRQFPEHLLPITIMLHGHQKVINTANTYHYNILLLSLVFLDKWYPFQLRLPNLTKVVRKLFFGYIL